MAKIIYNGKKVVKVYKDNDNNLYFEYENGVKVKFESVFFTEKQSYKYEMANSL